MADISKVTVPNGTTYDLKDATARSTMQPKNLGTTDANKTVITNSTGVITTRKLVEGYTVVAALPSSNIDQNTVYLIPVEADSGGSGGGGDSGDAIIYVLSRSGDTITLTGSNGSTYSVDGGLTETEVRTVVADIIDDALGVAY